MLNIIPLLLLVFGWIYEVKGLVIASLCVNSFFVLCWLITINLKENEGKNKYSFGVFVMLSVFTMSIIKLVI